MAEKPSDSIFRGAATKNDMFTRSEYFWVMAWELVPERLATAYAWNGNLHAAAGAMPLSFYRSDLPLNTANP